ncbi:DUF4149 domain-containing protein [Ramlibacter sp. H39-3-26]|jgi:hypothetical protein|uniref:DUF4149 domain-containing protein n=1 Tax=Curvibacter soli TaxID=3031331 RepID=UPI0023DB6FA1|nr:DUF4149 domain-containing protein [Ramlibacter sp. H39-3-26]MDF1484019.1 DUF4149 domain-containing protein [Ramlibacter sp. H39-3-26]
MSALARRLPVFAAALWWGSLTAIGFIAVPLLFAHLPTPAMAGYAAARIFTAQTWVSLACCVLLLIASKQNEPAAPANTAVAAIVFIVLGLLLALLVEYAVAPRIVARQNLRLWHGVGTAMYAVQWLCAAATLWKVSSATTHDQAAPLP